MAANFQSTINLYNAPGVVGDLAFTGPTRSKPFNLYSASASNIVGRAFTISSGANPNPPLSSPNAGTAEVGGAGLFAGILINSKEYTKFADASGDPLAPTLTLPNYSVGELATMGEYWINVDNQPDVGDLVTYDTGDGSLSTVPSAVTFVGSSSTTTLTVASISSGQIKVGMLIGTPANPGVTPGTYITALGTGLGGTGTYTISISQSIAASTTITVPPLTAAAFSGTATSSGTTLTIASVVSGQVYVGMPVIGTGFADGTIVTAYGTGVGGTGNYTINQANTVTPAVAIAATGNTILPNATISYYDIAFPGLAVIKLTN
jgi:hypothetical protein